MLWSSLFFLCRYKIFFLLFLLSSYFFCSRVLSLFFFIILVNVFTILVTIKIRIINFNEFIKLNRKFCKQHWPKNVSSFLVKKYEDNDFYLNEKYKLKILKPHWTTKQLVKTYSSGLKKGRFKLTKKGKLGTKFIP